MLALKSTRVIESGDLRKSKTKHTVEELPDMDEDSPCSSSSSFLFLLHVPTIFLDSGFTHDSMTLKDRIKNNYR